MSECGDWQDESESPPESCKDAAVSCSVPPQLSALPRLIGFLLTQGQRARLGDADLARLAIVIEELFVNTVTHGYADRETTVPEVRLGIEVPIEGVIRIDYRDGGVAFNPLTDGPAQPEAGAETEYLDQRLGGVGLWLLRHYAQQAEYRRTDGGNLLRFRIGRPAGARAQTKM